MTIYDLATLADPLAELYLTIDDSRRILTLAGFNAVEIEFSPRPRDNWWNILQASAYKKGPLSNLLTIAQNEHPENRLIPVILKEIVSSEKTTNGEPETKRKKLIKGFEDFLEGLGRKSNSKGLLIKEPIKDLQWFQQVMDVSQAVGMIRTPNSLASAILLQDGYVLTFFLNTTPDTLITTQLVLQYDSDENQLNQPHVVALDPSFIHNNEILHYTLLRRAKEDVNYQIHIPIKAWDHQIDAEVNLISHPEGKAKRISGGKIKGEQEHEIYYTSDSAPGSGGGPVILDNHVVAMHVGRKDPVPPPTGGLKIGIKIEDILKDAGLPLEPFMME